MRRSHRRRLLVLVLAALAGTVLSACGEQGIQVAKDDPYRGAAVIFNQRCAGCHTLDASGSEGSSFSANDRERKDGPNFNVRSEDYASVLYAIRNGGFSSGPMPQNIVVGREAELVACFVAKYSGRRSTPQRGADEADRTSPQPGSAPATGQSGDTALSAPENCPE